MDSRVLATAYFAYAWRNRLINRRTLFGGGAVIAAVTGAAYWSPWDGANTFTGGRSVGGLRFVASATGMFVPIPADYPTAYPLLRVSAASTMAAATIYTTATTFSMRDLIPSVRGDRANVRVGCGSCVLAMARDDADRAARPRWRFLAHHRRDGHVANRGAAQSDPCAGRRLIDDRGMADDGHCAVPAARLYLRGSV
jgi:hypothetical protein